jgi:hypothetical protein
MTTLSADRACNVMQVYLLRDAVHEEEVFKARKKARASIEEIFEPNKDRPDFFGEDIIPEGFEPPLDDVLPTASSNGLALLPPLQPETMPRDEDDPFPGLGPPVG